jgi:hypothetical protein
MAESGLGRVRQMVLQFQQDQPTAHSLLTRGVSGDGRHTQAPAVIVSSAVILAKLSLVASFPERSHCLAYKGGPLCTGAGLDSYVSKDREFLGNEASQRLLPMSLHSLERVHRQLPALLRRGAARESIDSVPSLLDGLGDLAEEHNPCAALVLSTLAHAYYFAPEETGTVALPHHIDGAWDSVCRRLCRPFTRRVIADDILNNARAVQTYSERNYQLASSAFNIIEERVTSGVQGAMELEFAPALSLMAEVQTHISAQDDIRIAACLERISAAIRNCTTAFLDITPQATPKGFDPVIWTKTYPAMGKVIREGELGNSGVDAPLFQALDCFFGQEERHDDFRGMQSDRRKTLPQNVQVILEALEASVAVREYVEKSNSVRLRAAFCATLQLYMRLLEWHRVKAVGMTRVLLGSGKHATSTGVKSGANPATIAPVPSPTVMLNQKMKAGIKAGMDSWDLFQTATVTALSIGDLSSSRTLSSKTALPLEAGDRIQVWPRKGPKRQQHAVSSLETAVRAHNALTNNTAFSADSKVPFYAYCNTLMMRAEQGLVALKHATEHAEMGIPVGHAQKEGDCLPNTKS